MKGPLPASSSYTRTLFMPHSFAALLDRPHTHKSISSISSSHLPFLLLKGNMMRLIDHHVVNHSKFVVAFSYISLCPHCVLQSEHILQLLSSSCSCFYFIQTPSLFCFISLHSQHVFPCFFYIAMKTTIPANW